MTKALFCIRDELVSYGDPFVLPDNDDVAKREFALAARSTTPNKINQAPQDMVLFRIARFDDQSGDIIPCKEQLVRASEVLRG